MDVPKIGAFIMIKPTGEKLGHPVCFEIMQLLQWNKYDETKTRYLIAEKYTDLKEKIFTHSYIIL